MEISLEELRIADAESLFAFEFNNKDFFEKMVPSRGIEYYQYDVFLSRLKSLLEEQAQGISYFYLIKDNDDSILGRINLVDIDKSKAIGYLGYRVGQLHTGKGIASKALKILLEKIANEGLVNEILAKTTSNNKASQRILVKNGFELFSTTENSIEIGGEKLQFVHYRCRLPIELH